MKESYGSSPTGPIFKGEEGTVSQHTWEVLEAREQVGGLSFSWWLWRTQACHTFSEFSLSSVRPFSTLFHRTQASKSGGWHHWVGGNLYKPHCDFGNGFSFGQCLHILWDPQEEV